MTKHFGIMVVIVIGLVFVAAGAGLAIFGSPSAKAAAARAEGLPVVAARDIDSRTSGSEVLAEGHISSNNQPRFHSFVAYVREEYRGDKDDESANRDSDDRERWEEDERVTPSLILSLSDGPAQVGNSDYELQAAPTHWQEDGVLTWDGFTGEGTKRYYGFKADDPALVIGTIVDSNEGHVIHAEMLYGGNRAEYIAGQRSSAVVMLWIGVGFAMLGGLCAAFGVWLFVRSR